MIRLIFYFSFLVLLAPFLSSCEKESTDEYESSGEIYLSDMYENILKVPELANTIEEFATDLEKKENYPLAYSLNLSPGFFGTFIRLSSIKSASFIEDYPPSYYFFLDKKLVLIYSGTEHILQCSEGQRRKLNEILKKHPSYVEDRERPILYHSPIWLIRINEGKISVNKFPDKSDLDCFSLEVKKVKFVPSDSLKSE